MTLLSFWAARDLAPLLGYNKWQRFEDAIERAKKSCETNGNSVEHHFTGSGKMIGEMSVFIILQ